MRRKSGVSTNHNYYYRTRVGPTSRRPSVSSSSRLALRLRRAGTRRLYEQSRDLGGKLHTISAVPMSQHDWKEQFRPFWGRLVSEKSRHDPDNVLGPGPGVFA